MRATKFEFKYRFWIISGFYLIGFVLSAFDQTGFIAALRQLIAPTIVAPNSMPATK